MGRWEVGRVGTGERPSTEYERDLKRTTAEILVDMASWFGEEHARTFIMDKQPNDCMS